MNEIKFISDLNSLGYSLVAFKARDDQNRPIYHTNVLMAIGTSVAVCNFDAIFDPTEAQMVRESLSKVILPN
jgi:hypothetical protein